MPPFSRGFLSLLRGPQWKAKPILRRGHASQVGGEREPDVDAPLLPKSGIRLRQYQEECIQSVLSYLQKGHKRLGISLATGSGKTVIFTQLIDRIAPRSKHANRTLILAHRQELVQQAAKHCAEAYPSKTIEIEMGGVKASGNADITIASVQSIISGDRMFKFDPQFFKLVLVDEAHHIVAAGYMKTLAHFGLDNPKPDSPALVGVSATLSRADGLRLGVAIDHIVYHKDYVDMIGEKWLSDVIFTTVQSKADLSKVKRGIGGDFQASELSKVVNTDTINEITVRSWFEKAQNRKATLVFCVDLAHVAGLTNKFRAHGIDARFVTGDTPRIARQQQLDAFRAGEFPVLVNCGVFTEGTDIPSIDCVILTRPTQSRNLLVQMIGRGMRLYPGKVNCHIIDMVASLGTGIICTPTLFGLDPSVLIEDASLSDITAIQARKEAEQARNASMIDKSSPNPNPALPRSITFTDYDSVFDLIEDTSGEKNIRAISPYVWVEVANDRYILEDHVRGYLRLERAAADGDEASTQYVVNYIQSLNLPGLKTAPYRAPQEIARCSSFIDSVHAADTYASKKFPHRWISRDQGWRFAPASEGQLNFLNKLRLKDEAFTADNLRKGQAGDMITKLKHGARGRFAKKTAQKRRNERAKQKVENELAFTIREKVQVGPVPD